MHSKHYKWVQSKRWEAGNPSASVLWEQMDYNDPVTHQTKCDSRLLTCGICWESELFKVWRTMNRKVSAQCLTPEVKHLLFKMELLFKRKNKVGAEWFMYHTKWPLSKIWLDFFFHIQDWLSNIQSVLNWNININCLKEKLSDFFFIHADEVT